MKKTDNGGFILTDTELLCVVSALTVLRQINPDLVVEVLDRDFKTREEGAIMANMVNRAMELATEMALYSMNCFDAYKRMVTDTADELEKLGATVIRDDKPKKSE